MPLYDAFILARKSVSACVKIGSTVFGNYNLKNTHTVIKTEFQSTTKINENKNRE